MKRPLAAVAAAAVAISVTSVASPAAVHAATTTFVVAGPDAWFGSASADGNMVIVHDGTQDLLLNRTTDGPPVPLPFRGGILTPDGKQILHAGPAPTVTDSLAEPPPEVLRYEIATGLDTVLTAGLSDDWAYSPASSNWDGTIVGIEAKSDPLSDRRVLILDTTSNVATYPDALLPDGRSFGITLSHRAKRAAFSWMNAEGTKSALFVYDASTASNILVTSSPLDEASSRPHHGASISGEGGHVVYVSDALDILAADPPPETPESPETPETPEISAVTPVVDRVLLYDIDDDRTMAVARTQTTGVDDTPSVSADGTRVAFLRNAPTTPPGGPTVRAAQLFVRDLELGVTRQITLGADGSDPNGPVTSARLVADGLTVFWDSTATNYSSPPAPTTAAVAPTGHFVYAAALPALAPCTITGTNGPDTLTGTPGDDVICGLGGNDSIRGLSGNDVIRGGAGNDKMAGGPGNDRIHGGDGNDYAEGGDGNDALRGGNGRDALHGTDGDDVVQGGDGNDLVTGGGGNDELRGGPGRDVLQGGNGVDQMFGADGNDALNGGNQDDTLDGGRGNDTVNGGNGHDSITAGEGNDTAGGGNGNDVIHGNAGADVLEGNNGGDDLYGDEGRDRLYGGPGNDDLDGGPAVDLCRLGPGPGTQVNCEV